MKYEQIVTTPVVETERFTLRPVKRSDAGLFALHAGDLRVARMTQMIPHPFPPGAAENYLANAMNPAHSMDIWALDGAARGGAEFMGMIMLGRLDRDQSEVSFWIPPAFWNKGFASEALSALIEANPHDAKRLFATAFQDNPGSARVLTNCGFEYLGDAEAHSVARGANVPTWTYSRSLEG